MPFVQRVIEPVYLSRKPLRDGDGKLLVDDYELEAVNNNTLSSALRQLACLVLVADDIFQGLTTSLQDVCDRSRRLRTRINAIEQAVVVFNPKTVTVPESDICTFSLLKTHYKRRDALTTSLFTAESRPDAVRQLYDAAAATPVHVIRQMDRYRADGARSSRFFMCTPVMGSKRRRIRHRPAGMDIETRTPAAFDELRRWTSTEALGDVTVAPDCSSRIALAPPEQAVDQVDATADHRLPSPEEQVQVVALHFPSEVVRVDTSGRMFDRMSSTRRSLEGGDCTVTRRSRSRRPRGKRRNTIAATTELQLAGTRPNNNNDSIDSDAPASVRSRVVRSHSSDLLRSRSETSPPEHHKSRFSTLRSWGRDKLNLIRGRSGELETRTTPLPEDINIYETITKGKRSEARQDRRAPPQLPSSGQAVRLRPGSIRQRKEEPIHSSSGNWSASSESGRASVGSENTATTHQPKSTTTLSSPGTSSVSLNHAAPSSVTSRRRLNTSTSSSFSEGTLTPDLPGGLDEETGSIYSCDTEGYYTSFHVDSGLKTLKEEDVPITALLSTTALSHSPRMTAENEYELFGKGSTSTTTSSAGTVCTTLLAGNNDSCLSLAPAPATPAPDVPERKSSLDVKQTITAVLIHTEFVAKATRDYNASQSPDSGHNTSSSPVDSTGSQVNDLSESDFEATDRMERFRVKTTIDSSRIPSMCVITPPQSDDEMSLSHYEPKSYYSSLPRRPSAVEAEYAQVDWAKKKRVVANLPNKLPVQETHFDAGDYVTIADVRDNLYANCGEKEPPPQPRVRETEYVCLNDIPSPADSLERNKRHGARVKLNAEGKVVYSSDSLKRVKAHTTFEPGVHVKDGTESPTASPIPLHRVPKSNIRPVNLQGKASPMTVFPATYTDKTPSPILLRKSFPSPKLGKVIIRANSPAGRVSSRSLSPKATRVVMPSTTRVISPTTSLTRQTSKSSISPRSTVPITHVVVSPTLNRPMSPKMTQVVSPTSKRSISPRIVATRVVSPTQRPMSPKDAVKRVVSPTPSRGAYVHMQEDRAATSSSSLEEEGKIPPLPNNPKQLTSYLQRTNPSLFSRIVDPKVKRSDSYRMANSSLLAQARDTEQLVNTFYKQVILETNRLEVVDSNAPLAFQEKVGKEVVNPNLLGRKFYGAQLKIDPTILGGGANKGKERARVLSAGNNGDTEIW